MTTSSSPEVPESLNPASLRPGSWIDVETRSRHYRIECLGGNAIRISGHPEYCLTPVAARLHGSIHREGPVELGLIERGSKVMVFLNGNLPLVTSRVLSVHVHPPESGQSRPPSGIH